MNIDMMNIEKYTEISKNIEVPDSVKKRFDETIDMIKAEQAGGVKNAKDVRFKKPVNKTTSMIAKVAAVVLLFGTVTISAQAYIRHQHMEAIRNMPDEEVISLYENVYKYSANKFSREISKEEDRRYGELFIAYSSDIAEPGSQVPVIEKKREYKGKGVAFCKEDGIMYIPDKTLSDEELLEIIEFDLIGNYIVNEGYEIASNPDHYMNALKALSDEKIDEIYINETMGGTPCNYESRAFSEEENARRKALKKLYMYTEKKPAKEIRVISEKDEYTGIGVAFCTYDSTYYLPETDMTDEDLMEYIDYRFKQDYAISRINSEIDSGKRAGYPLVEYVNRERRETLENTSMADSDILSSDWLLAYSEAVEGWFRSVHKELDTYFAGNDELSDEEKAKEYSDYYFNVSFIFLNDDDIPEMLLTRGYTPFDSVQDTSDRRIFLYTVKEGEAVQLRSDYGENEGFYAQLSPFRYAERKGMVLNEGHYEYSFNYGEVGLDNHDHISDTITRMDYWDLDTLTCTHTDLNIKLENVVYNELKGETYDDGEVTYEYYVGVKDISRDDYTGVTKLIKGRKVSEEEYSRTLDSLWEGEEYRSLTVSNFDKIYSDYDITESLAESFEKQIKK